MGPSSIRALEAALPDLEQMTISPLEKEHLTDSICSNEP